MPDMERMLERMLEGLALLTQQVSRLAYAVEAQRFSASSESLTTCRACQSRLQPRSQKKCGACGEQMGDG